MRQIVVLATVALLFSTALILNGCSSGIERLESVGVKASQVLVNLKTETGFEMTNLRIVFIDEAVDFDAFLQVAPSVEHIRWVSIRGQQLSCEQIDKLLALGPLDRLTFEDCKLDAGCLAKIADVKSLERLAIVGMPVTTNDIQFVTELPILRLLNLSRTNIDNTIGPTLAEMPIVEDVRLSETKITDEIVPSLLNVVQLEEIRLNNSAITSAGILAMAQHENVERIHATHLPISDALVDAARRGPKVRSMVLDTSDKDAKNNSTKNVKIFPASRADEADDY